MARIPRINDGTRIPQITRILWSVPSARDRPRLSHQPGFARLPVVQSRFAVDLWPLRQSVRSVRSVSRETVISVQGRPLKSVRQSTDLCAWLSRTAPPEGRDLAHDSDGVAVRESCGRRSAPPFHRNRPSQQGCRRLAWTGTARRGPPARPRSAPMSTRRAPSRRRRTHRRICGSYESESCHAWTSMCGLLHAGRPRRARASRSCATM